WGAGGTRRCFCTARPVAFRAARRRARAKLRAPTGTSVRSPRAPSAKGSAATPHADRRTGSRATASRGSARAGTLVGGRVSSLGLFRVLVFVAAAPHLCLTFSIQFLARPEHVGDGKLVESCSLDRVCDVDLDLHVLLVALEGRAPEVAAG